MTSKELQLDHFKFYDVANLEIGEIVALKGQFDKFGERVRLTYLNLFANPVSKNGEPIYDKNAHLTWYDLFDPTPDPTRAVVVANQFGKQQQIHIGRSCALLVPAQKYYRGSVFPEKLGHYKVYQVLHGEPVNKTVKLEDQFGGEEGKVDSPLFFAVPVKKWTARQAFEIHNEKAHLLIYRLYPSRHEKTILVRDQFGRRYLNVFRSVLLGVPSLKLKWTEVKG